ncbi:Sedlin [Xylaria sp. CBS 124048]|nr:Sedlin [Xylaria sp. CBS 124048]
MPTILTILTLTTIPDDSYASFWRFKYPEMANTIPSIACLGVIGRNNNPLHITIFNSYNTTTQKYVPARTPLQYSLLLSGTLDIFESRSRNTANAGGAGGAGGGNMLLSGDFGLLHAIDERLAAYGFETNTGVKFVAIVDMRGRIVTAKNAASGSRGAVVAGVGLRDTDLKPIFRAMQTAYVHLLQNPFYDPDETTVPGGGKAGGAAKRITSRKFGDQMRRIGEAWVPGATSL